MNGFEKAPPDTGTEVAAGAAAHSCRQRYLLMFERLFPASPSAGREPLTRRSIDLDQAQLLAQHRRLSTALRGEIGRGHAGHWSFDANRLLALRQTLARCSALLAASGSRQDRPAPRDRP